MKHRRSNISRWILPAIAAGVFTWLTNVHSFQFPGGKGLSALLLLYCIGIYLVIVILYAVLLRIAVRFGILPPGGDPSARTRAFEIGLALASMGLAFPVLVGIWKPLFSPHATTILSEQGFDAILIFPLFVSAGLMVLGSIGLLVPRRALARQGVYLVAFIVLGFFAVLLVNNLTYSPRVLTDLKWLTGDRPAPRNDFVLVRTKGPEYDWAAMAVELIRDQQPKRVVLLPWIWGVSQDRARQIFSSLSAVAPKGPHLLIGLPLGAASYAGQFSRLDLAIQTGYYDPRFKPAGAENLPDVAIRLAQLRGADPVQIQESLRKKVDRDGWALIDSYSTRPWHRSIPVVLAEARDSRWEMSGHIPEHAELGLVTFQIDKRTGRLISANDDDNVAGFFASIFEGRTVIIEMMPDTDVGNSESGELLSSAVLNLEYNEVPQRLPVWVSVMLVLVFLAVNLSFYYGVRPLQALGLVLLTSLMLIAFEMLLLMEFHVLIGLPLQTQAALGTLVILIFFPYEFMRERREITREQTRLSTELRAAREMQMGLMPKEDPVVPGFDISGICLPANEVGGDFFDYLWLDEKKSKLGIAVADVSGKAMKAAITAVMTSGMVYRELGGNETPKTILQKINRPMYAKLDRGMFTALSFAVLDVKKKVLAFSNAGQMHPVWKSRGKVKLMEVKGVRLPLGIREEVPYGEMTVDLRNGDVVVFYTDGIAEAMNEKEELYEVERLLGVIEQERGAAAKELRDEILADVQRFVGKAPQHDDMTVVVVRVVGESV